MPELLRTHCGRGCHYEVLISTFLNGFVGGTAQSDSDVDDKRRAMVEAAVELWNETGHGVTPAAIAKRIGADEESVAACPYTDRRQILRERSQG